MLGQSNKTSRLLISINIFYLANNDILPNFAEVSWKDATTIHEPYDLASFMHYEK